MLCFSSKCSSKWVHHARSYACLAVSSVEAQTRTPPLVVRHADAAIGFETDRPLPPSQFSEPASQPPFGEFSQMEPSAAEQTAAVAAAGEAQAAAAAALKEEKARVQADVIALASFAGAPGAAASCSALRGNIPLRRIVRKR